MADAFLRVTHGPLKGTEFPLADELVFGRDPSSTGSLAADAEVSRRHARVAVGPEGQITVEDLGSTNGTYLNGWLIPSSQLMSPGDRLQMGQTVLELVVSQASTQIARRPPIVTGVHESQQYRPSESTSVLYVTGVKKSYGDLVVLSGVDLEIQPGEVVGLLGPNGAGKTTLVSIVAGLRGADEGSVRVKGVDALADPVAARRHLGLAPQDLGIYPTLTVERNLRYFGELNGLTGSRLRARVREVGEALSLTPLFERSAGNLSGGQKRRLHTGMAMLHAPALLILDEPTVGADIRTRQEILEAVKTLAASGHAICYSTHYLPEIEELGASVAILDEGQIAARGAIAELVSQYATPAVELRFAGPAPEISYPGEVTRDDSLLRVTSERPDEAAAEIMQRLGPHADRLRGVEVIRPSLDSVYLALTKKRYAEVERDPAGPEHDLAPPPVGASAGGPGGVRA